MFISHGIMLLEYFVDMKWLLFIHNKINFTILGDIHVCLSEIKIYIHMYVYINIYTYR